MNQNQLNREVANATGETVEFIRQRGFGFVNVPRQRPPRPRRSGGQKSASPKKRAVVYRQAIAA